MRAKRSDCILLGALLFMGWVGGAGQTRKLPQSSSCVPDSGGAIEPDKYCIDTDDVLYVLVWRERPFTGSVVVNSHGNIRLPLIGSIQALGLTPLQLAEQLTDRLRQYVSQPHVTVTVQETGRRRDIPPKNRL